MTQAKKKFDIDPSTGFPVVPEGYFWRVGPDEGRDLYFRSSGSQYGVALYKIVEKVTVIPKRWRRPETIKHEKLERVVVRGIAGHSSPLRERLALEASEAYSSYLQGKARDKELVDLMGDYPPKKL